MKKFKDIKELYAFYLPNLKFDNKFYKEIIRFNHKWATKNEAHIDFLNSPLLGPDPIRFTELDEDRLISKLLGINGKELRRDLFSLDGVYPERKVSSNPVYNTLYYLMYRAYTDNTDKKQINKFIEAVYMTFAYKVMSSLVSNYFKHGLDRSTAIMVFEGLHNSFINKKEKTWHKVFVYRSKDLKIPDGLHAKKYKNYNAEEAGKIIADCQGRIRGIVKNIFAKTLKVKESKTKLSENKALTMGSDGEVSVATMLNRADSHLVQLNKLINDKNSFIKRDIVDVTLEIFNKLDRNTFVNILDEFLDEAVSKDFVDKEIVQDTLRLSIEYLNKQGINNLQSTTPVKLVFMLKNYWSSSVSNSGTSGYLKKEYRRIVSRVYTKRTEWFKSAYLTALILYILILAFIAKK